MFHFKAWKQTQLAVESDVHALSTHNCTCYRSSTSTSLNLVLLNLRRPVTWTTYAKPEDPQCDPLLLLSLSTSRPRLLQTVYRPILHIFNLFPQYPFLLFRGIHATTASPPPARTCQGRWNEGRIYDLECVEVWECLACNDKFRYHRTCYSSRVEQNSRFPTL